MSLWLLISHTEFSISAFLLSDRLTGWVVALLPLAVAVQYLRVGMGGGSFAGPWQSHVLLLFPLSPGVGSRAREKHRRLENFAQGSCRDQTIKVEEQFSENGNPFIRIQLCRSGCAPSNPFGILPKIPREPSERMLFLSLGLDGTSDPSAAQRMVLPLGARTWTFS